MYYDDLSPYVYDGAPPRFGLLNVGWLDKAYSYATGTPSAEFLESLAWLHEMRTHKTRGIHPCPFCPGPEIATGNAEIRVHGRGNTVFSAPSLILHYVTAHGYSPPSDFVESVEVLGFARQCMKTLTLGTAIERLNASGSEANKQAMRLILLASEVGGEVPSGYSVGKPQPLPAAQSGKLAIPTTRAPDGSEALLVFCEVPSLVLALPDRRFFEVKSWDAIKMAAASRMGLIVQNLLSQPATWAFFSASEVVSLLQLCSEYWSAGRLVGPGSSSTTPTASA
jgi:hypothetical protein